MRHGIEFGLGEMLYTYFLQEHDREKGLYNFYVQPDWVQLEVKENLSNKSGNWESETRLKGKFVEAPPSLNIPVYSLM